jgi:hypothetical protein
MLLIGAINVGLGYCSWPGPSMDRTPDRIIPVLPISEFARPDAGPIDAGSIDAKIDAKIDATIDARSDAKVDARIDAKIDAKGDAPTPAKPGAKRADAELPAGAR